MHSLTIHTRIFFVNQIIAGNGQGILESEQMTTARGFAMVDHNRDEKLSSAEVQMFVQKALKIYKESLDQYSDFLLRILFYDCRL